MKGSFLAGNLLLEAILNSFETFQIQDKEVIWFDQFLGVLDNLKRAIEFKDGSAFSLQRGIKVDRVVGIEEFIESREFLDLKKDIRPAVKREMIRCFESEEYYLEIVCTGAIGIGKNFFGIGGMLYNKYLCSCLWNPQAEYGLPIGSSIYFIIQSRTASLSKKSVFNELKERVQHSAYFQKYFMYDKKASQAELRFPNNFYITPFGGADTAALGLQVMGSLVDEVNDMLRVSDSAITQFTGEGEYNQANRIYNTLKRRMESRFQTFGRIPGKIYLLGSSKYPGDFTDSKIAEEKEQRRLNGTSTIFVFRMSQWQSIPASKYTGKNFLFEKGNDFKRSRIIDSLEDAKDPEDVREVPIEYLTSFQSDPEGASRDLLGESTSQISPYMPKDKIKIAVDKYLEVYGDRGLFHKEEIILSYEYDANPNYGEFIDTKFLKETQVDRQDTNFYAHLDIGLAKKSGKKKGDAFGLDISRIFGYKFLPTAKVWNKKIQEFVEINDLRVPIYAHIGTVRLVGYRGSQVDLNLARDFLIYINELLNIAWVTSDSFQHVATLQALKRLKITCATLSAYSSPGPYEEGKMSLIEERTLFRGVRLVKELRELERDTDTDRIHHPEGGSCDEADAWSCTSYMLQHKEANYGRPHSGRRSARRRGGDLSDTNVTNQAVEGTSRHRSRFSGVGRRIRFR